MQKKNKYAWNEILESIHEIIFSGITVSEIIEKIYHELRKIIPCDRIDIALAEEKGRRIEVIASITGYNPVFLHKGYIGDMETPGDRIEDGFKRKNEYLINDFNVYRNSEQDLTLTGLLLKEGIASFTAVPVLTNDITQWILFCGSKKKNSLTEDHILFIHEIAKELSRVILSINQQNLIEQNHQAYMEMLSFVSHELRSPISSIITMTRTMLEGYYGRMEEKQLEILKRVIKKAEYLDAVSNHYLNLSRLESNMMKLHPVLVDFTDDIIEPTLELLMPQIEERGMIIEREYSETVFPVLCDPEMIRIVLMNLLSNAVKYGNKSGVIRISLIKKFKRFAISVWNEGEGFSEEGRRRLFKKFSRIESGNQAKKKGSGIGLYLSWTIIQLHGGRLIAESEHGKWAKFSFELAQHMDFCIME